MAAPPYDDLHIPINPSVNEFNTKIPAYMKSSVEKEAIASIDMF